MSSDTEFVFYSSNLPKKIYPLFEEMRRKSILCDITFKVGECSVFAHRIVLAAGIPYFRDFIYNDAATNLSETSMELPNIAYSALEALIEFVYSCKITITLDNVKDLLSAACALHVEEVREACCTFVAARLEPEIVLNIRDYAHNLNCLDLVEISDHYIRKNFDEVSQSEGFLDLPFAFLEELIRRDDLRVSGEDKVYESVIRWVKNLPDERRDKLPELLKKVRLTLLNPRYLSEYVASQEFIRTSIPCRDLLDEAKNYHLFPEKLGELFSFSTEPRNFEGTDQSNNESVSGAAVCVPPERLTSDLSNGPTEPRNVKGTDQNNSENMTSAVYVPPERRTYKMKTCEWVGNCTFEANITCSWKCFDYTSDEWCTHASHTVSHNDGLAVQFQYNIYLFFESFSLEYSSYTGTYFQFLQCFQGVNRTHTGAAVSNGCLYVCGGKRVMPTNSVTATNMVTKFDFETKEWLNVPVMSSRRMLLGAVALRGCIYVLGGQINKRHILRSVERYDFENECWTKTIPMLSRRYGLGCAALNDRIYVCGGKEECGWLNTAEVFDPEMNEWKFISPMINARSQFSLIPYRGTLYVLGGYSEGGISVNVSESYHVGKDAWTYDCGVDFSYLSADGVILLIGKIKP